MSQKQEQTQSQTPGDPPAGDDALAARVTELRTQLDARVEELAAAEAQRDEARHRLTATENRLAAERLLAQAGVVDVETAALLLGRRVDLEGDLESEALEQGIEGLLLDKPFLRCRRADLPPSSASAAPPAPSPNARLADAADRAMNTGNRRDVAEYLRLKRRSLKS